MNNKDKITLADKIGSLIIIIILFFFLLTIGVRFFTRQILVEKMNISNSFIDIVFFDAESLNGTVEDDGRSNIVNPIDWSKEYPFKESPTTVKENSSSFTETFKNKILNIENKIDKYTTDFLVFYNDIVSLSNRYESIIKWSYASYEEYNGVVKLSDDMLTSYIEKRNISDASNSVVNFANSCKSQGIDFVYVQAPYKISSIQDFDISGTLDFSNQNADAFIEDLKENDIDVFDLREEVEKDNLDHHSLFYKTDHHWKGETGLWAAHKICNYIEKNMGYDNDFDLLSNDLFRKKEFKSAFLGTQGRKLTKSQVDLDDFAILYPTYTTDISFKAPEVNVDLNGDFSIVYDMKRVEFGNNDYRTDCYGTYVYGDYGYANFKNHLSNNNIKILFIHDSFGDCVVPFLSLGFNEIDSLDIRHFNGSVQSFIKANKPDMVVLLYNPSTIPGNEDTDRRTFDFR